MSYDGTYNSWEDRQANMCPCGLPRGHQGPHRVPGGKPYTNSELANRLREEASKKNSLNLGPAGKNKPMKTYKFIITLYDTGLPYPDRASAEKDADEWAQGIADTENCLVADVQVDEED